MSSEFTEKLPLSRHHIDRDYLARGRPGLFENLFADPDTRVLPMWNGTALLADDGASLALLTPSEAPTAELLLYLGRSLDADRTPYVAVVLSDDAAASFGEGAAWGNLRSIGMALSDLQAGLFTEALALANWHSTHLFSPRTGEPTSPAVGGWIRRVVASEDDRSATATESDLFPRTDAAIIVGVTDAADRILLVRNAMWGANRYSLLAGFVEPGESLENAVVREVFEESGIRIVDPVYLGSQPWPFPASLMLGFRAKVDPGQESTLEADGNEILELRWFSRADLTAALGEIALPGGTSIARAILEDWYGGPIVDRREW